MTMKSIQWLFKMAWRDSRRNRSRLMLFILSVVLGIAALVSIYSLGDNLRMNVDLQAAEILGADIEVSGNKPVSEKIISLLDSIGGDRSEEKSFASMVLFPKNNGTRLVQVRALEGAYPYYGKLETQPADAGMEFRKDRSAVVDKTLMLQYNASVGDSVMVGNLLFRIAGILEKAPGQTGLSASVAPAVYIPMNWLDSSGLLQKGSRINYKVFYKFNRQPSASLLENRLSPVVEEEGYELETIESQKEDTGRSFQDLTEFLSLVAFIALLLGCIGVASAIHIYVREKIPMVAILRCLGTRSAEAFWIFLIQIIIIGMLGSVAGALLGVVIQQFLPLLLKDFMPVAIETPLSWAAIGQGILTGVIISILFALLPLMSVRNISPLNTLRLSFQEKHWSRDPVKWLIYLLILAFMAGFIYWQLGSWKDTLVFLLGILAAYGILTGMATLLIMGVRKFFPSGWSYLWRQGLSNLFRPNNQTVILVVSIGLGTALICTLVFVQSILINRVKFTSGENQPNIVLFDIQTSQRDDVVRLAKESGLPVQPTVPIVNMRLEKWNDMTADLYRQDTTNGRRQWLFSREYRVTFRDSLTAYEKITEGEWKGHVENGNVYISIEEGYAKRFDMKIGDTLLFNVQGAMIPTIIGSFREVDWNRIQTNFLVVFPAGVLENAPQFHVLLTRVPSPEVSASFQQKVVKAFPNISIIDLALVLNVIDELLDKIAFVIRFIAAFSIITGLVVLIASVLISKFQRLQESVLLRTLGAVRRQVFIITALEYFFLGALAAITGILIALVGSWLLAEYSFETRFTPSIAAISVIFFSICFLTVLVGLINSWSILRKAPLEVSRE